MEEISQKEGAAVRLPYDVIVVGAGAAGMMAAGTAARNGHRVLLLEKMEKSGRKVRITGKDSGDGQRPLQRDQCPAA